MSTGDENSQISPRDRKEPPKAEEVPSAESTEEPRRQEGRGFGGAGLRWGCFGVEKEGRPYKMKRIGLIGDR